MENSWNVMAFIQMQNKKNTIYIDQINNYTINYFLVQPKVLLRIVWKFMPTRKQDLYSNI